MRDLKETNRHPARPFNKPVPLPEVAGFFDATNNLTREIFASTGYTPLQKTSAMEFWRRVGQHYVNLSEQRSPVQKNWTKWLREPLPEAIGTDIIDALHDPDVKTIEAGNAETLIPTVIPGLYVWERLSADSTRILRDLIHMDHELVRGKFPRERSRIRP